MMSLPRLYLRFVDIVGIPILMFVAMGGLHFVDRYTPGVFDGRSASVNKVRPKPPRVPGYQIQPRSASDPVIIAARDLAAEPRGSSLIVRAGEIRLALPAGKHGVEYRGMSLLVYQGDKLLGRRRDEEQRGFLHREEPLQFIRDWTVSIPNAGRQCRAHSCRARLIVSVMGPGSGKNHVNSGFANLHVVVGNSLSVSEKTPSRYWDTYYRQGMNAKRTQRYGQARKKFEEALAVLADQEEAVPAAAARIEFDLAFIDKKQGRNEEYRRRLERAYEYLDPISYTEATRQLRGADIHIDKELVAGDLGSYYWDQRDYANSYKWYRLAYDAVASLDISESVENSKLAGNSSGIMATACMLGLESESMDALNELKRRFRDLSESRKKALKYWVESGERFHQKGRCRK